MVIDAYFVLDLCIYKIKLNDELLDVHRSKWSNWYKLLFGRAKPHSSLLLVRVGMRSEWFERERLEWLEWLE